MAASKRVLDQDENMSNESAKAGDPNMVGKQASAPVQDRRAGKMTGAQEYDEQEPFNSPKVQK